MTDSAGKPRAPRKRATSQEDRFQTIFEFAPDAYYINDLEGRFVDGNRCAEELIGYDREELLGRSFLELDLLPPESLALITLTPWD